MSLETHGVPKVLTIWLELSQYPILGRRIRQRMREELFKRGVISQQAFEGEVKEKAVASQAREGMRDPMFEEPLEVWEKRLAVLRDDLTDFYFAYNLPHEVLRDLVQEAVRERTPNQEVILSFNPELAPWDMLFNQGEAYEKLPPEQRVRVEHHLREIIVVLIKAMISDQLSFVRVARRYFGIQDLKNIREHRIGRGKIGGKAAGMLLAYRILQAHASEHGLDADRITLPDSWFLGSDVFYQFHYANGLYPYMNQKYKTHAGMREDYPHIRAAYLNGHLPEDIAMDLHNLLEQVGDSPLIVRSSSLLEDSFDTSFAGKYDSFFLTNRGRPEERFRALERAIISIYASVARPEALIYREQMGLTDYDERMAILIQRVEGKRYGRYFYPAFSGVGFSHNPYRWNKRIEAEQGMLRMVVGLGTRAVDRVGNDYPRMVALSHPTLRPEVNPGEIRHYSQRYVDVVDVEGAGLTEIPITDVLTTDFPALGVVASQSRDGMLDPLDRRPLRVDPAEMVVTFDRLLKDSVFADLMRKVLDIVEKAYQRPVDMEWAAEVLSAYPTPQLRVTILQCRPLSQRKPGAEREIPENIPQERILFRAAEQIPDGYAENIRYMIYVDPAEYAAIEDAQRRIEIGQAIGRINLALANENFILMGPGRWGSSNIHLGVKVTYGDIFNAKVLVEIANEKGPIPEVSYGTHFFQDLVEANIYPLPLIANNPGCLLREDWLREAPNLLSSVSPADAGLAQYIRVVDVPARSNGLILTIIMRSDADLAIGFLEKPVFRATEQPA